MPGKIQISFFVLMFALIINIYPENGLLFSVICNPVEWNLSDTGPDLAGEWVPGSAVPEEKGGGGSVSAYLDSRLRGVLAASGIFKVSDATGPQTGQGGLPAEGFSGNAGEFTINPEISCFHFLQSGKSGLFFSIIVNFGIADNSESGETMLFPIKSAGWGITEKDAMMNSLEGIINQFEYLVSGYEKWSGSFRVADIYQGTLVVNSGKSNGVKKGDFLQTIDFGTGEITGNYVVERSDDNISYAKILTAEPLPRPGDPVVSEKTAGLESEAYTAFYSGERFTGINGGAFVAWTRGLYVFHPLAGVDLLVLSDSNDNTITLAAPYAGFRIVRHIGQLTLSSMIAAGTGYLADSEIAGESYSGWKYRGARMMASAKWRAGKQFSLSAGAGYSYWFSDQIDDTPDVTGFILGLSAGVRF